MSTYTPQRSNKSFCLNLWDFIPYSAYTTEQNANEFRFFHQRAEFCFHFEKNRESGKLKPNQKISLQFSLSIRLFLINFKIYLCFFQSEGKKFQRPVNFDMTHIHSFSVQIRIFFTCDFFLFYDHSS